MAVATSTTCYENDVALQASQAAECNFLNHEVVENQVLPNGRSYSRLLLRGPFSPNGDEAISNAEATHFLSTFQNRAL